MKRIAPLFALLLAACGSAPTEDRHEFKRATWVNLNPRIEWKLHASLAELRREAPRATPHRRDATKEIMAWGIASPSRCEIHIVDPRTSPLPARIWIAHEVMHCMFGDWHD